MLTKKYYDGFIVHDILYKHLEPGKMMEVLTAFSKAKGVDAVEVIRCKDCKYHRGENACEKDGCYGWYDTDYCSRAGRREDD